MEENNKDVKQDLQPKVNSSENVEGTDKQQTNDSTSKPANQQNNISEGSKDSVPNKSENFEKDDELERLKKENERLKEIQRLREENKKLSEGYTEPQTSEGKGKGKNNKLAVPLIAGVVAVVIVVVILIFGLHMINGNTAKVSFIPGKISFTSANLSGVTESNLGNLPLSNVDTVNFSKINNSGTSLQFFKGPIGTPVENYAKALSNLSSQLKAVGSEQLSGSIQCIPAANTSGSPNPSYCVLLIGNANYDIIPIKIGGNSTVKVGSSSTFNIPKLTYKGKPTFVYMGAQGCPFCAGERWALIVALSRFGNFSNLFYDRSATNDGNVPTFTFDYNANLFYNSVSNAPIDSGAAPYGDNNPTPFFEGAYYNSSYLNFIALDETGSSFLANISGIAAASPFVFNNVILASQAFSTYHGFGIYNFIAGGVPFFDINNQYVFDGANIDAGTYISSSGLNPSYSTHQDMLDSIENPTSGSFGQTVLGAANILTAQICETLNNSAPVCKLSYISGLEQELNSVKV